MHKNCLRRKNELLLDALNKEHIDLYELPDKPNRLFS